MIYFVVIILQILIIACAQAITDVVLRPKTLIELHEGSQFTYIRYSANGFHCVLEQGQYVSTRIRTGVRAHNQVVRLVSRHYCRSVSLGETFAVQWARCSPFILPAGTGEIFTYYDRIQINESAKAIIETGSDSLITHCGQVYSPDLIQFEMYKDTPDWEKICVTSLDDVSLHYEFELPALCLKKFNLIPKEDMAEFLLCERATPLRLIVLGDDDDDDDDDDESGLESDAHTLVTKLRGRLFEACYSSSESNSSDTGCDEEQSTESARDDEEHKRRLEDRISRYFTFRSSSMLQSRRLASSGDEGREPLEGEPLHRSTGRAFGLRGLNAISSRYLTEPSCQEERHVPVSKTKGLKPYCASRALEVKEQLDEDVEECKRAAKRKALREAQQENDRKRDSDDADEPCDPRRRFALEYVSSEENTESKIVRHEIFRYVVRQSDEESLENE